MDNVVDRSDKLMVAEAVSLAKLSRLGEAETSAWTSSRRAVEAMLPARPSWLADSQSSRSLSGRYNWLALPNDADPDADKATLASPAIF